MRDSAVLPESRAAGRSRPGAGSRRQAGRSLPACREGLGLGPLSASGGSQGRGSRAPPACEYRASGRGLRAAERKQAAEGVRLKDTRVKSLW